METESESKGSQGSAPLVKQSSTALNVLTRTSGRPQFFYCNYASVQNQDYSGPINHLVSYDDQETDQYLEEYRQVTAGTTGTVNTSVTFRTFPMQRVERQSGAHFPYNLYLNHLQDQVEDGWIMFLDDDDWFLEESALSKIISHATCEDDLLLWKVQFPGRVVPRRIGRKPRVGEISCIGFMFHSKHLDLVNWGDRKGGDYQIISHLYQLLNPKWINQVLTGVNYAQTRQGGSGQRQDLHPMGYRFKGKKMNRMTRARSNKGQNISRTTIGFNRMSNVKVNLQPARRSLNRTVSQLPQAPTKLVLKKRPDEIPKIEEIRAQIYGEAAEASTESGTQGSARPRRRARLAGTGNNAAAVESGKSRTMIRKRDAGKKRAPVAVSRNNRKAARAEPETRLPEASRIIMSDDSEESEEPAEPENSELITDVEESAVAPVSIVTDSADEDSHEDTIEDYSEISGHVPTNVVTEACDEEGEVHGGDDEDDNGENGGEEPNIGADDDKILEPSPGSDLETIVNMPKIPKWPNKITATPKNLTKVTTIGGSGGSDNGGGSLDDRLDRLLKCLSQPGKVYIVGEKEMDQLCNDLVSRNEPVRGLRRARTEICASESLQDERHVDRNQRQDRNERQDRGNRPIQASKLISAKKQLTQMLDQKQNRARQGKKLDSLLKDYAADSSKSGRKGRRQDDAHLVEQDDEVYGDADQDAMLSFFGQIYIIDQNQQGNLLQEALAGLGLKSKVVKAARKAPTIFEFLPDIIRDAQKRTYPRILVLMDNVWPHKDLLEEFALQAQVLPEIEDWKVLYVGASHNLIRKGDLDWQFYLEQYPDLVKANINDQQLATRHWRYYGQKENRYGARTLAPPSVIDKTISAVAIDQSGYDEIAKYRNATQLFQSLSKHIKTKSYAVCPLLFMNEPGRFPKSRNRQNLHMYQQLGE